MTGQVCEHCGEELRGKRAHARYCDSTCRADATRLRAELRGEGEKTLRNAASSHRARPSDRSRVLAALRAAGPQGLHSHDIRRRGLTGHPSERAAELERMGYEIRRKREYIDGRNGVRFYLLSEPVAKQTAGVGAGPSRPRQGESLSRVRDNPHASVDPGEPQRPTGAPGEKSPDRSDKPEPAPSASDREGAGSGDTSHKPEPASSHEPLSLLPEPDPEAWAA